MTPNRNQTAFMTEEARVYHQAWIAAEIRAEAAEATVARLEAQIEAMQVNAAWAMQGTDHSHPMIETLGGSNG